MAFEQDVKVLSELGETLERAENRAADDGNKLPKEHLSDFSTENMSYLDISAAILKQAENLFLVTGECNRLDPEYLSYCRTLVNAVNHLGSAFITKTAMHMRKFPTTQVETLTAERLNRMLSFNFRKCDAALTELQQTAQKFDLNYFNMLLTFDKAMQRLRATQKRAYGMNLGYIEPHRDAETALSFTEIDGCKKYVETYSKDAPFRSAPAYAIRNDAMEEAERMYRPAAVCEEVIEADISGNSQAIPPAADVPLLESAPSEEPQEPAEIINVEPAEVHEIEETAEAAAGPNLLTDDLNEPENEEDIHFAVDIDEIDISDADPILEGKVRYLIEEHQKRAWYEIFGHLQDPTYCRQYPDYVKVFAKIIKEMMAETPDPGGT